MFVVYQVCHLLDDVHRLEGVVVTNVVADRVLRLVGQRECCLSRRSSLGPFSRKRGIDERAGGGGESERKHRHKLKHMQRGTASGR